MIRLAFKRSAGPIDESLVREYEGLIGAKLPDSYRSFLLETNGGVPAPSNNSFLLHDNPDFLPECKGVSVDRFYELIGVKRPALSLTQVYEQMKGRIPTGMIPIATDDFGNLFLLGILGPFLGEIYFWDHETEGFERNIGGNFHNLGKLTNSFESFIDSLTSETILDALIDEAEME